MPLADFKLISDYSLKHVIQEYEELVREHEGQVRRLQDDLFTMKKELERRMKEDGQIHTAKH